MAGYMRLRQICLVAPQLETVDLGYRRIMGLNVCYRDGKRRKYDAQRSALCGRYHSAGSGGGRSQPGTCGGTRSSTRHGRPRRLHGDLLAATIRTNVAGTAKRDRLRVANVHRSRALSACVQLHPRDCRADSSNSITQTAANYVFGPYRRPPGLAEIDRERELTQALTRRREQSPEPQGLAEHRGQDHRDCPQAAARRAELKLPNAVSLCEGASDHERLTFKVADIAKVRDAPRRKARGWDEFCWAA
jgi:hypothetical protein